jgi:hypothetical protein
MKQTLKLTFFILLSFFISFCSCKSGNQKTNSNANEANVPIALHPQNPHYFLFRGKPAILIGSTEHYGAVMNFDFDYKVYLDELAASGLNVTRTFTGIYVEPAGAFGINKNTLAPAPGKFICPWARSSEPGYANGGNRFDLSVWDEAYFTRLKDFIKEAGKRDIIVELDLFSNIYDTVQWKLSPLFYRNNINDMLMITDWKEVLSLRHPELIDIQVKMVRKIVTELKDFDNLYYEVCNEPYFGDTTALREWEEYLTGVVDDSEKEFKNKHLISNNVANNSRLVPAPRPFVSIYNFHYARPPLTVDQNYHLNRVIGDNETGFDGINDATYRREAWDFILAGGAVFNNLDYSFTADNEDGTFVIEKGQPGGGGKTLRGQLKILADLMRAADFINMAPAGTDKIKIKDQEAASLRALAGKNNNFVVYLSRKDTLTKSSGIDINLQAGSYTFTWIDTKSGKEIVMPVNDFNGGWLRISSPKYSEDLALRIEKDN